MRNLKIKAGKSLAVFMAAMSMMSVASVPAFAATPSKGNNSTAGVTYHLSTTDGAMNDDNEGGAFKDAKDDTTQMKDVTDDIYDNGGYHSETKVVVEQGSTVAVQAPFKITLDGKKDADNKADYQIRVRGDIDGDTQINVVPNTTTIVQNQGMTGEAAAQADNFDRTKGTGTFLMAESAGVKKAITATITQKLNNTRWTMGKDGTDDGAAAYLDKTKTGKVEVANLSAGAWENDIMFDISVSEIDSDYTSNGNTVTPNPGGMP